MYGKKTGTMGPGKNVVTSPATPAVKVKVSVKRGMKRDAPRKGRS